MGRKFNKSLGLGLLSALFNGGCLSSSPLEYELSKNQIDYSRIVELVGGAKDHKFELRNGTYQIGEKEVLDLVNEHNYSILSAKSEYESAKAEFERKQWTYWRPSIYSKNTINGYGRDFRDSIVQSRVGAGLSFPDGSTLEIFSDNQFNENSLDREDRTHTLGGRLIIPVFGLHPAYHSNNLRDFTDYLRFAKSKNEYLSRVRRVILGGLNSYVSALKYKSRVNLQKQFLEKLEKLKIEVKNTNEKSQLELLLSSQENELRRLTGKYQNKISDLKNQLGIPLEQKIDVKGKLAFNSEFKKSDNLLVSKVLSHDYNLRNLILYLKQSYLVKKEGEKDYRIRPSVFVEYSREVRGEDDLSAGLNVEFLLGPTKEKEGKLNMQKFEYLIRSRKDLLELQTMTTIRDLNVETQQIPIAKANSKESSAVLNLGGENFKAGKIKFSDLQIFLMDWYNKQDQLLSVQANGMELNYNLKSLLGGFEREK